MFCSIIFESPYHVNYYEEPNYLLYFLITFSNLLIYLIPTDKISISEKFVYASIISLITLFVTSIFVEKIMGLIFGYDSNYDELKSPEILDGLLFYFISNFGGIGIFKT